MGRWIVIALLALGAVAGFGSGLRRLAGRHHGWHHGRSECGQEHDSRDARRGESR